MTTAEFIKMLQEADPDGTSHVRMYGGVPIFADAKPGYWDGPYHYIDEEGNWVYSSEGTKVDIWCKEIDDFVSEMMDTYNIPSWEEVKSKFKFKLTYASSEERENAILKQAKEAYDSSVEMYSRFRKEGEERALKRASEGWTWFQNKLVDDETLKPNNHHYYTWKIYEPSLLGLAKKEEGSNPYNVEAVMKSGLFERLDNNKMPGYYEWVLKK